VIAFLAAVTIGVYLWLVHCYGLRFPRRRFSLGRMTAFVTGVALFAVVLAPPFERWADASFAAHMTQHIVLMLVAPPLVLLGAPLLLLITVPSPTVGRRIAAIAKRPVFHALFAPVTAWLLFVFALWGAHFSPLYEAALEHPALHIVEHLLFVAVAFLFWIPIAQAGYTPRPFAFPARMLYLFLALPQGAFLGLAIYSSRHVLYPHYAQIGAASAALVDQQNGGAIMWIAGGLLLFLSFMITAGAWAYEERREATA